MLTAVVIPVLVGLGVTEFTEFCPWLAYEIIRWSAYRRYDDPERAATRSEELQALIEDRPGKLFKLLTACGFASAALAKAVGRDLSRDGRKLDAGKNTTAGPAPAFELLSHGHVLSLAYRYIDGGVDDVTGDQIRQHLDECGPCLREYGLEELVTRLVGHVAGETPGELRARIAALRAEIDTQES